MNFLRKPSFLHYLVVFFISISLSLSESLVYAQGLSGFSLDLPKDLGRLEESFQGTSGKTIIYLQDAHTSLEAQENIAELITRFVEREGVETVYEEGYEGPVPTERYFGFMKDAAAKEKVAYFLMDKLRIGGAEYAHINRKKEFKLIGADDTKLHLANIQQYRKTAELSEETREDLTRIQSEITQLANRHFPKPLKKWMKLKERLNQNKINIADYLTRLEGGPALLEKIESLDAKTFFQKIEELENNFANKNLKNKRDQRIFHYYQGIQLLSRLEKIELTPAEFQAAHETVSKMNTEELAQFIADNSGKPSVLYKRWEQNIKSAIRFYELAQARDRALETYLETFLQNSKEKKAVLVYGGFHKDEIKRILRSKNLSYQIVTPAMGDLDEKHEGYYKHLMSLGSHPFEIPMQVKKASRVATLFRRGETIGENLVLGEVETGYAVAIRNPTLDRSSLDLRITQELTEYLRQEKETPQPQIKQPLEEKRAEVRKHSPKELKELQALEAEIPWSMGGRTFDPNKFKRFTQLATTVIPFGMKEQDPELGHQRLASRREYKFAIVGLSTVVQATLYTRDYHDVYEIVLRVHAQPHASEKIKSQDNKKVNLFSDNIVWSDSPGISSLLTLLQKLARSEFRVGPDDPDDYDEKTGYRLPDISWMHGYHKPEEEDPIEAQARREAKKDKAERSERSEARKSTDKTNPERLVVVKKQELLEAVTATLRDLQPEKESQEQTTHREWESYEYHRRLMGGWMGWYGEQVKLDAITKHEKQLHELKKSIDRQSEEVVVLDFIRSQNPEDINFLETTFQSLPQVQRLIKLEKYLQKSGYPTPSVHEIQELKPKDPAIARELLRALLNTKGSGYLDAIKTMGPYAKDLLPELGKYLKERYLGPSFNSRFGDREILLIRTMKAIGGKAVIPYLIEAIPALADDLGPEDIDPDHDTFIELLKTLTSFGEKARPAISVLKKFAENTKWKYRRELVPLELAKLFIAYGMTKSEMEAWKVKEIDFSPSLVASIKIVASQYGLWNTARAEARGEGYEEFEETHSERLPLLANHLTRTWNQLADAGKTRRPVLSKTKPLGKFTLGLDGYVKAPPATTSELLPARPLDPNAFNFGKIKHMLSIFARFHLFGNDYFMFPDANAKAENHSLLVSEEPRPNHLELSDIQTALLLAENNPELKFMQNTDSFTVNHLHLHTRTGMFPFENHLASRSAVGDAVQISSNKEWPLSNVIFTGSDWKATAQEASRFINFLKKQNLPHWNFISKRQVVVFVGNAQPQPMPEIEAILGKNRNLHVLDALGVFMLEPEKAQDTAQQALYDQKAQTLYEQLGEGDLEKVLRLKSLDQTALDNVISQFLEARIEALNQKIKQRAQFQNELRAAGEIDFTLPRDMRIPSAQNVLAWSDEVGREVSRLIKERDNLKKQLEETNNDRAESRFLESVQTIVQQYPKTILSIAALLSIWVTAILIRRVFYPVEWILDGVNDSNYTVFESIREDLIKRLVKLDSSKIPHLITKLQDKNVHKRIAVASALGQIGDDRAIFALQQSAKDRDERIAYTAKHALKQIDNSHAISLYVRDLKQTSPAIVNDAVTAITKLLWNATLTKKVREDETLVNILTESLAHNDRAVRAIASKLLEKIVEPRKLAVSYRLNLQSPINSIVEQTIAALGRIGNKKDLPAVVNFFTSNDEAIRKAAISAVNKLSQDQATNLKPFIPSLLQLLQDSLPEIRKETAHILRRLNDKTTSKALVPLLNDPNDEVRMAATSAIDKIGIEKEILADAYRSSLNSPHPNVRDGGLYNLSKVGEAQDIPIILNSLTDLNSNLRSRALMSAQTLGATHEQLENGYLLAAKSSNPDVQIDATLGLIRFGSNDTEKLNDLLDRLVALSNSPYAHYEVLQTLSQYPQHDHKNLVKKRLKDPDSSVRLLALRMFSATADASSIQTLLPLISDPASSVQGEVRATLNSLVSTPEQRWLVYSAYLRKDNPQLLKEIEEVKIMIHTPQASRLIPRIIKLLLTHESEVRYTVLQLIKGLPLEGQIAGEVKRMLEDMPQTISEEKTGYQTTYTASGTGGPYDLDVSEPYTYFEEGANPEYVALSNLLMHLRSESRNLEELKTRKRSLEFRVDQLTESIVRHEEMMANANRRSSRAFLTSDHGVELAEARQGLASTTASLESVNAQIAEMESVAVRSEMRADQVTEEDVEILSAPKILRQRLDANWLFDYLKYHYGLLKPQAFLFPTFGTELGLGESQMGIVSSEDFSKAWGAMAAYFGIQHAKVEQPIYFNLEEVQFRASGAQGKAIVIRAEHREDLAPMPTFTESQLPPWAPDFIKKHEAKTYATAEDRMRLAIELSRLNVEHSTGGPFGAAIFERKTGRLISVGVNLVVEGNDSRAHAEMVAIGLAEKRLKSPSLGQDYELVTSAQPCIQCFGGVWWAWPGSVVTGATGKEVEAITGFKEGPIPENWVDLLKDFGIKSVKTEVLRDEAVKVLIDYSAGGGDIYNGNAAKSPRPPKTARTLLGIKQLKKAATQGVQSEAIRKALQEKLKQERNAVIKKALSAALKSIRRSDTPHRFKLFVNRSDQKSGQIEYLQELLDDPYHFDSAELLLKEGSFLDLGAGNGVITKALAPLFARTVAVESDPVVAKSLQKKNPSIHVVNSSMQNYSKREKFDLILISHALYYLTPQEQTAQIQRFLRWLKPGGKLVLIHGANTYQNNDKRQIINVLSDSENLEVDSEKIEDYFSKKGETVRLERLDSEITASSLEDMVEIVKFLTLLPESSLRQKHLEIQNYIKDYLRDGISHYRINNPQDVLIFDSPFADERSESRTGLEILEQIKTHFNTSHLVSYIEQAQVSRESNVYKVQGVEQNWELEFKWTHYPLEGWLLQNPFKAKRQMTATGEVIFEGALLDAENVLQALQNRMSEQFQQQERQKRIDANNQVGDMITQASTRRSESRDISELLRVLNLITQHAKGVGHSAVAEQASNWSRKLTQPYRVVSDFNAAVSFVKGEGDGYLFPSEKYNPRSEIREDLLQELETIRDQHFDAIEPRQKTLLQFAIRNLRRSQPSEVDIEAAQHLKEEIAQKLNLQKPMVPETQGPAAGETRSEARKRWRPKSGGIAKTRTDMSKLVTHATPEVSNAVMEARKLAEATLLRNVAAIIQAATGQSTEGLKLEDDLSKYGFESANGVNDPKIFAEIEKSYQFKIDANLVSQSLVKASDVANVIEFRGLTKAENFMYVIEALAREPITNPERILLLSQKVAAASHYVKLSQKKSNRSWFLMNRIRENAKKISPESLRLAVQKNIAATKPIKIRPESREEQIKESLKDLGRHIHYAAQDAKNDGRSHAPYAPYNQSAYYERLRKDGQKRLKDLEERREILTKELKDIQENKSSRSELRFDLSPQERMQENIEDFSKLADAAQNPTDRNQMRPELRTSKQSKGTFFIDADDLNELSVPLKKELLAQAVLHRSELRIVIVNEHGQLKKDRATEAIRAVARVTPDTYEVVKDRLGVPNASRIQFVNDKSAPVAQDPLMKAVLLKDELGIFEFSRRLLQGPVLGAAVQNRIYDPKSSLLDQLNPLKYLAIAYSA